MIGPRWMEILSERLNDAEQEPDVRDEIAAALERDFVVILVLVECMRAAERASNPNCQPQESICFISLRTSAASTP